MFDWLPNSQNTVNVTNSTITPGTNPATVTLDNRWVTMATGKFGYAWDRLSGLWQRWRCLGRNQQPRSYGQ